MRQWLAVGDVVIVLHGNRLRWYESVLRKDENDLVHRYYCDNGCTICRYACVCSTNYRQMHTMAWAPWFQSEMHGFQEICERLQLSIWEQQADVYLDCWVATAGCVVPTVDLLNVTEYMLLAGWPLDAGRCKVVLFQRHD